MSFAGGSGFNTTLSRIAEVKDRKSLDAVMEALAASYDLKSAAYFGVGLSGRTNDDPFLVD